MKFSQRVVILLVCGLVCAWAASVRGQGSVQEEAALPQKGSQTTTAVAIRHLVYAGCAGTLVILVLLAAKMSGRAGGAAFNASKVRGLLDELAQQSYREYAELATIREVKAEAMTQKLALANEFVQQDRALGHMPLTVRAEQIYAIADGFTTSRTPAVNLAKYHAIAKPLAPLTLRAVLDYVAGQSRPEEFFNPLASPDEQLEELQWLLDLQEVVLKLPLEIRHIQRLAVQTNPTPAAVKEVQQSFAAKFSQFGDVFAKVIALTPALPAQQQRLANLLQAMEDLAVAKLDVDLGVYSPDAAAQLYLLADLYTAYVCDTFAFLKAFIFAPSGREALSDRWQQAIAESASFLARH